MKADKAKRNFEQFLYSLKSSPSLSVSLSEAVQGVFEFDIEKMMIFLGACWRKMLNMGSHLENSLVAQRQHTQHFHGNLRKAKQP